MNGTTRSIAPCAIDALNSSRPYDIIGPLGADGMGEVYRARDTKLHREVPIAKQIAEALEAAHDRGIIHRDHNPANIKVRDVGTSARRHVYNPRTP